MWFNGRINSRRGRETGLTFKTKASTKRKRSKMNTGMKIWQNRKHPLLGKHIWKDKKHPLLGKHIWINKPNPKGMKGKHHSEETKEKIRLSHLGKTSWNKGFGDYIKAEKNPMYGKQHTENTKRKISEAHKGRKNPKLSEIFKIRSKDPEFIKRRLKGLMKRPTKPEKYLDSLIQKHFPNEFQYTGDGKIIINGLCPDFTNCNGKKLIIEVFGNYWHSKNKNSLSLEEREKRFAEFGYKMIVIWENELKTLSENEIVNKIEVFLGG